MPKKPKQEVSETEADSSKEESASSVEEPKTTIEPEPPSLSNDPKKEKPVKEVPQSDGVVKVKAGDLADMTSGLPEPNQNAIDAENAKKAKTTETGPKSGSGKMSKNGKEEFDSDFHASDKDGNPIPTKAGGFRKKPGRKSNRLQSRKVDEEQVAESENREALVKSSAFAATQATQFALGLTLSMKPDKSEQNALFDSYREYYDFAGPSKMPPWLAPVLVTGSIIANHIDEEAPKTRVDKIKEWVGVRWHRLRNKKDKKSNEVTKKPDDKRNKA